MRWSLRERKLCRHAAKKGLDILRSRIDGTFMILLELNLPLHPQEIKFKPYGKRDRIHPPEAEHYDAASLREAEEFVRQFVPPWSREIDPTDVAAVGRALTALATAARKSRRKTTLEETLGLTTLTREALGKLLGFWNGNGKVQ